MMAFEKQTIGEIVTAIPTSANYFKELQIDFCCGGNRLLEELLETMSLNKEEVYATLQHLQNQQDKLTDRQDFNQMSKDELADYIVQKHHRFLRKHLPIVSQQLETVLAAHGNNHPELYEIFKTYHHLEMDLMQHIIKEEAFVFPTLFTIEQSQIHSLFEEHEVAGSLLLKLRTLTNQYQLPSDACSTYLKLYENLEVLEEDTHQHVHLENNILLKEFDIR